MSLLLSSVRSGAYRDSIVLMQLQAALADLPGIEDAGAVMGTPENLALLDSSGLLPEPTPEVGPSDVLVVVRAVSESAGAEALERIDDLLRRDVGGQEPEYRARSLETALQLLPEARWALVSVPGPFAASVARVALELGLHVFLFSDHVPLAEEIQLKRLARESGLLLMGPDCGTAWIGGVGFGFANSVRRGSVGIVAASGTGLQAVACSIDAMGGGVSHGIGTGGRDVTADVGGITAVQALELLQRDGETRVIVLISKPPDRAVAERILAAARSTGKPAVVVFQGFEAGGAHELASAGPGARPEQEERLCLAANLEEAASLAVELSSGRPAAVRAPGAGIAAVEPRAGGRAPGSPCLRGLFSGGTLALEALLKLRGRIGPLHSNVAAEGVSALPEPAGSCAHTILDLGADEFTLGRPHPMIANDLRVRRLRQEASDPAVGLILIDVVLGYGAHPDPSSELAPAIAEAARPDLAVGAIVIGTPDDPQNLDAQIVRLEQAGAIVFRGVGAAVAHALDWLGAGPLLAPPAPESPGTGARAGESTGSSGGAVEIEPGPPVSLADLQGPISAINVGLEVFGESLTAQGAKMVQVRWEPPARGDRGLVDILEKLRR